MKMIVTTAFLLVSNFALALPDETQLLKYVPEGKIVKSQAKEVKILTPAQTIVEVEFKMNGEFEEASGDDVTKDSFHPGQGLLSLQDAVKKATSEKRNFLGEWNLESNFFGGWAYEFEGYENNRKVEYVVDARTGKLLSQRDDD